MSAQKKSSTKAKRKRPGRAKAISASISEIALPADLLNDLRGLINEARTRVAVSVNAEIVMLNWHLGQRIWCEVLDEERAEYGKNIVEALSRQLSSEYGRGFSRANLFHMVHFAQVYPEEQIVYALSRQLSWTHLRILMYLNETLQREFYTQMCRVERWSTRTLKDKISSMLYERSALSKKPEKTIRRELERLRTEDQMTPDMVFHDPVILRQLGLADSYSEKDLENAILREIEMFLKEMGSDFAFMERQKQIVIDGQDYWIDLLFYHRSLRRLFVVDLKIGRFKAEYKGQMELYLRWLEENEMQEGENEPLGLILCAGKSSEQIRLLKMDRGRMRVAEYMTELPPREILEKRLRQAIQTARGYIENEKKKELPEVTE